MSTEFLGLLVLYLAIRLASAPCVGRYIRRAMEDDRYLATAWGRPLERVLYRVAGVRANAEMGWKQYAIAVIAFNMLGVVAVYVLQRVQVWQPI